MLAMALENHDEAIWTTMVHNCRNVLQDVHDVVEIQVFVDVYVETQIRESFCDCF